MRPTGNPASVADQGDRLAPGGSRLGDLSCGPVAKVAVEGVAVTRNLPGLIKVVGQVLPPQGGPRVSLPEIVEVDGQVQGGQAVDQGDDPLISSNPECSRSGDEVGVVLPDKVAEDVDFSAVALGGQLDPRDQLDTDPGRFKPSRGNGRNGVVVGDRQGSQADARCRPDHVAGGAGAIGVGGVDVEIGPMSSDRRMATPHASGRGLSSGSGSTVGAGLGDDSPSFCAALIAFIRSRTPLTNLLD